ncbi:MAG: LamG-like jellyroll fold domain-containing protein [Candidatus Nanohaloarchaea archaeon]
MSRKTDLVERKTLFASALVTLVVLSLGFIGASEVLDADGSDNLGAEYRFDEGAGGIVADSAGSKDGIVNGARWSRGRTGSALRFYADGDWVDTPYKDDGSSEYSKGLTVSLWAKRQGSSPDSWPRLAATDCSEYWCLIEDNGGNDGGHDIRWTAAGSNIYSSTILEKGEWRHIVGVYDPSGEIRLYINGELEVTSSASSNGFGSGATRYMHIGAGTESSSYPGSIKSGTEFNGTIDQVKIFSEDLNRTQVKSLYNQGSYKISDGQGTSSPDKVLDVSFTEKNSTHVFDTSGNKNHGKPNSGAIQQSALGCKVGRCYEFKADSGRITADDDRSLDLTDNHTVQFWMKMKEPSSSSWDQLLVKGDGGSRTPGLWFQGDGTNTIHWRVRNCNNNNDGIDKTNTAFDVGKWYHLAGVYNNASNKLKVYVNGQLDSSAPVCGPLSTNSQSLYLGQSPNYGSIEMKLDQVKIYKDALKPSEIIEKTQGLESKGAAVDLRFSESGGDYAHDTSSYGNDGRLEPNAVDGPNWTESTRGSALDFDGLDDRVEVPDSKELEYTGGGKTIEAWFYSRDDSNSGSIVSKPWNGMGDYNYRIDSNSDDSITLRIQGNETTKTIQSSPVSSGWHHAVGVLDSGKLILYLDGELVGTKTHSIDRWVPLDHGDDNLDFTVGTLYPYGDGWSGDTNHAFNGKIDDVTLFQHALSSQEVKEQYARGVSRLNSGSGNDLRNELVLYQSLDRVETCGQSDTISCPSGMNGEIAVDESGAGNHGELVNGPRARLSASCVKGSCLEFDASDDYVSSSFRPEMDSDTPLTFSVWVYPTKIDSNKRSIGTADNGGWDWLLGHGRNEGEYHIGIGSSNVWQTGVPVDKNRWQHLVVVWDIVNGQARFYKNGKLMGTNSNIGTASTGSPWTIGSRPAPNEFFGGKIDQARLYNRSLSSAEVWELYTQAKNPGRGEMPGPAAHWKLDAGKVGTKENPAASCLRISNLRPGAGSGKYWITGYSGEPQDAFKVFCDMKTQGGGWTKLWFTEDHRTGFGFVACESSKWKGKWSSSAVLDLDPDCDQDFAEHYGSNSALYDLNLSDERGSSISDRQVQKFAERINRTVYNSSFRFQDADNNCDGGREPVTPYANSGPSGNSVNVFPTMGNPASDTSHVVCGGGNSGSTQTISGSWRTIMTNGIPTAFGVQSGNGDTGCWRCSGYDHGYGSTVEFKATYFFAREGKGMNLTDSSGEGNEADMVGDPRWVSGRHGKALKFDGNDDYLDVNPLQGPFGQKITVSAWLKPSQISGDNRQWIVEKGDGFMSYIKGRDSSLHFRLSSGGSTATWDTGYDMKTGEWQHVTLVYDGAEMKAYVNGELQGGKSKSGDLQQIQQVSVGMDKFNGNDWYAGKIDDIRIYPYALNQNQVKQVMNGGGVSVG